MRIALTQNKFTLIDEADYATFKQYTWHAHHSKNGYWRVKGTNSEGKTVYLHRIIMDAPNVMTKQRELGSENMQIQILN